MGAPQALDRLVLKERDVREEVPSGQLQLDDRAVALPAAVAARADRAQVPPVSCLDQPEVVEQFAEQGDAGHRRHVVLGRLDHDRRHPLERPLDDGILDLEQARGSLHLVGAP